MMYENKTFVDYESMWHTVDPKLNTNWPPFLSKFSGFGISSILLGI